MTGSPKLEPIDGELPVTLDRAATLCGVTEKTIRSWIANGMPVMQVGKQGRGKVKTILDLAAVMQWYLEQDALDAAKTRLASAQADKHEMENALRRGELADVADVEREWSDLVLAFRSKMLSLPTKLAPQIANVAEPAVIAARVRDEVHVALDELANDDSGRRRSKGAASRRGEPSAAAAGSNRKRVGGRKAKAE